MYKQYCNENLIAPERLGPIKVKLREAKVNFKAIKLIC
jgi:hypothetical protein